MMAESKAYVNLHANLLGYADMTGKNPVKVQLIDGGVTISQQVFRKFVSMRPVQNYINAFHMDTVTCCLYLPFTKDQMCMIAFLMKNTGIVQPLDKKYMNILITLGIGHTYLFDFPHYLNCEVTEAVVDKIEKETLKCYNGSIFNEIGEQLNIKKDDFPKLKDNVIHDIINGKHIFYKKMPVKAIHCDYIVLENEDKIKQSWFD